MTMCRVLNVARAGFYAWLHNPVSARDKDNQRLLILIRDSCSLSGGNHGTEFYHDRQDSNVAVSHSRLKASTCKLTLTMRKPQKLELHIKFDQLEGGS